jgi:hypothetical protein
MRERRFTPSLDRLAGPTVGKGSMIISMPSRTPDPEAAFVIADEAASAAP